VNPPEPRSVARRVVPVVAVALFGAVAALVALSFVSVGRVVGPGHVTVRARVAGAGETAIGFPPLGRVTASTHSAPVEIDGQVDQIDIERLQTLLGGSEPEAALRAEVEAGLEPLVRAFAVRALLVGTIAGAIAGALVPRRRLACTVIGGMAGAAAVTALLFFTWSNFEPEAFDEPEFTGALERAPAVIDAVQRHVDDLPAIRDRIDVLSTRLSRLYAVATAAPEPERGDEVRVLHVSDIHSNPLALEIVASLAERFDVDAVLDTGDLTSFGYPIESELGRLIRRVDRPYYFVPGNHDSDANRAALARVDDVHLLDGDVANIDGVRVLGVADPTFTATNETDSEEATARREAAAPRVGRLVERRRPDVLAVHDRTLATTSFGSVPLVVSGHHHARSERTEDGTLVLTVGSTGATGLGSFTVEDSLAYEAQVLHFTDGELRVVDYLALEGLSGNYEIDRRIVEPEPTDGTDDQDDDEPDNGALGPRVSSPTASGRDVGRGRR
jgi:predicted phosphodiesterase